MKRIFAGLLAVLALLSLCAGCAEKPVETTQTPTISTTTTTVQPTSTVPLGYDSATVILYTANVRGDVSVYAAVAAAKAAYEQLGATVYLVDAGNYLQGSAYANYDMGATIYQIMDAAGYDVAGMGIYDFAHGEAEVGYAAHGDLVKFYTQAELYRGAEELTYRCNAPWSKDTVTATRPARAAAGFSVICSNLRKADDAKGYYDFDASVVLGDQVKVGFVSYLREDAAGYLGDGFLNGYEFAEQSEPECDFLVSLGGGDGDLVIDIPEDGTLAVGAYVIYPQDRGIAFEQVDLLASDDQVHGLIASITPSAVIGTSEFTLNGSLQAGCNGQTDLGSLVADALKWYAENKLEGVEHPVIGLFNGGNCRNFLYDGQITETDIRNALHASQAGVGVVYLTGAQLLEALEAATQRENCPGWAQVSGVSYHVDTTKPFDFGGAYGAYYEAASINRVSVLTEGFDLKATYAVVTDTLLLKGEDTYYLFAQSEIAIRDQSGADVCQIVAMYIQEARAGQIGG